MALNSWYSMDQVDLSANDYVPQTLNYTTLWPKERADYANSALDYSQFAASGHAGQLAQPVHRVRKNLNCRFYFLRRVKPPQPKPQTTPHCILT
jgi:hypothetical protein